MSRPRYGEVFFHAQDSGRGRQTGHFPSPARLAMKAQQPLRAPARPASPPGPREGPRMDINELISRFRWHPAITDESKEAHIRIRRWCMELAADFNEVVPDGREKSLAMTHIEEAMFWANAAIARNGGPARREEEEDAPRHIKLPGTP